MGANPQLPIDPKEKGKNKDRQQCDIDKQPYFYGVDENVENVMPKNSHALRISAALVNSICNKGVTESLQGAGCEAQNNSSCA
jgi:hypothetical protein